jgi:transcriptional regulator with XRE-family HTH domain
MTRHDWARRWREKLGWTQEELAEALGVNVRLVSAMEGGIHTNRKPVSARTFARYRLQCAGVMWEARHGEWHWE